MSAMAFAALLLFGSSPVNAQTNTAAPARRVCCQEMSCAAPLSGRSVYQLTSDWTTDTGAKLKLSQLRGKPQVVAMMFTSCQSTCPLLVHEMQQVAESLPPNLATNTGFLLVTFDSERDTPEKLYEYRLTHHLSVDQWTLLHGNPDDIHELALVLGVKYREDSQNGFSHSNLITVLNAEGEIAFQQTGLDPGAEALTKHLTQLLKP